MQKHIPIRNVVRITAIISFLFFVTGCGIDRRYDDTVRQYVHKTDGSSNSPNAPATNRYTLGQHHNATAHYNYLPGNRPALPAKVIASTTATNDFPPPENQIDDNLYILDATDILFEFDKSVIQKQYYPELNKWAAFFVNSPHITAEIYGHADSTGTNEYNQGLSERRAQAIMNYLIEKGVAKERLSAFGFGETKPIATNSTPEGRQKNRRVELYLQD